MMSGEMTKIKKKTNWIKKYQHSYNTVITVLCCAGRNHKRGIKNTKLSCVQNEDEKHSPDN